MALLIVLVIVTLLLIVLDATNVSWIDLPDGAIVVVWVALIVQVGAVAKAAIKR